MTTARFDPGHADGAWIGAWITGRALARGLPLPFPDRGGWRAEIGSDSERRRWIFSALTAELRHLAEEIADPALKLRALATPDAMRAHLPAGWRVEAPSFAMAGPSGEGPEVALSGGYRLEVQAGGTAVHAFVRREDGELAAWGHGGAGPYAYVSDRIVTQPDHRRRGLATGIMAALSRARPERAAPMLLVATEAGRPLYEALGWRVVAPYASASWAGDSPVQN